MTRTRNPFWQTRTEPEDGETAAVAMHERVGAKIRPIRCTDPESDLRSAQNQTRKKKFSIAEIKTCTHLITTKPSD